MTTPSPAPQWAKDAAEEYIVMPSDPEPDSKTYVECDRADLAAIITKHAAAISEENRQLRQWSEQAREAIVELVGYVDRFGQQGVRDRAHALLATHPAATNLTEERK